MIRVNSNKIKLDNNDITAKDLSKMKSSKKMFSKEDYFEIPSSRKIVNLNQANNSLNISLNLIEPSKQQDDVLDMNNPKKFNSMEKKKNLLILPLNEDNPFNLYEAEKEDDEQSDNNDEFFNLNPELRKLKEEYDSLKEEYNRLKCYLEKSFSIDKSELKEKERLKKKIKKRLKQIKDYVKEKTNL